MKWNKWLLMLMAIVGLGLTTVACSEKDDEPGNDTPPGQNGDVPGVTDVDWVEDGNTITFTLSQSWGYGYGYKVTTTCKFDNQGLCYSAIAQYEFPSAELADVYYTEAVQLFDSVSKSGKVVTVDETEEYRGMTKEALRTFFEQMKQSYNSMN